jgi:biopolymer transport protein ExbB/TolQ
MLQALALMSQVSLMTLLRKLLLFLRVKKRKEKRKKLLKMRTEVKQKMSDWSHLKLHEKQQKEKHH